MNKILSTAAMTVLAGLLLTGCSGIEATEYTPAPAPSSSSQTQTQDTSAAETTPADAAPANAAPAESAKPLPASPVEGSVNQELLTSDSAKAIILEELRKVDPTISTPENVDRMAQLCKFSLTNKPERVKENFAKRIVRESGTLAEPDVEAAALKLVEAVKSGDFCQPAN